MNFCVSFVCTQQFLLLLHHQQLTSSRYILHIKDVQIVSEWAIKHKAVVNDGKTIQKITYEMQNTTSLRTSKPQEEKNLAN